ncbi:hypothetical protein Q7P37_003473 [Cladosporium fusiforme]
MIETMAQQDSHAKPGKDNITSGNEKTTVPNQLNTKAKKALTVLWNDLPTWQQDNQHIHSGYRPASNSYNGSVASLAYLHNESVNIYTHLVGALLALAAGVYIYGSLRPRYAQAMWEDVTVFACFFGGAVACLGMSATYHTVSNHSERVARLGNKLDYLGIVILIWGSFVPSVYYGLADKAELVRVYWSMITSIGAATTVVVLFPRFRTPAWRPFRAFMFVMMGMSAIFPVLHGVKIFGAAQMEQQIGLSWLVTQGVLYILGAGIYAARVPERWAPGTFDIWGSSHQIFHVLVVMAAGAHLIGLLKAFDYAHASRSRWVELQATWVRSEQGQNGLYDICSPCEVKGLSGVAQMIIARMAIVRLKGWRRVARAGALAAGWIGAVQHSTDMCQWRLSASTTTATTSSAGRLGIGEEEVKIMVSDDGSGG